MADVNLSKSRYTAYCKCPKNMWLGVYHPEKMDKIDPALQARFESGTQVGELAKRLFSGTVDVSTRIGDALDLKAMMEKTQQCLTDGTEVIAEASFAYEGCYCAVDLLRREGDGWAIYEVKSTTNKDEYGKPKKFDKYFPDIAYQTWVLRQCGINVTGINLVCLNRDYVRQGELNLQHLFAIIDMREAVENELLKVPIQVPAALRVMAQDQEPENDLSKHCDKPYKCAFWGYCTDQHHLPEDSVFKVYGSSTGKGDPTFYFDKKLAHYRAGRVSYDDLVDQPLGVIQRLQVERKTHIDRNGIRNFLNELNYPLYFLDFETMQDVIPQYDGTHPCMQIPFQYSLHVKRSADAAYEHYEFLSPSDGSDPRRSLAEQLCRDIPMNVCTLAYNMSFEKGRIDDLAKMYPDLAEHLRNIRKNIHDLLVPFRNGYYYLPDMGGSFSIKSVLPALFPGDDALNYKKLDKHCQNGGDAMTIFPRIQHMEPAEAAASREALLRYCELDTWAMVKVWEKLKKTVESNT
jgi:hypothetical protein